MMRTYIKSCIDRVIGSTYLTDSPQQEIKLYTPNQPVCLVGFLPKHHPPLWKQAILIDSLPCHSVVDTSQYPYFPFLITTTMTTNPEFDLVGVNLIPSQSGYVFPCEAVVSTQPLYHDFNVPFRYRWIHPYGSAQAVYFEEIDFILFRCLQNPVLFDALLPGLIRQLAIIGNLGDAWSNAILELFALIRRR